MIGAGNQDALRIVLYLDGPGESSEESPGPTNEDEKQQKEKE